MGFKKIFLIGAAAMLMGGCSHKAEPVAVAAYDVTSSYSSKVKGKWLLYIDSGDLDTKIHPSTHACSAHNYPLVLSGAFRTSIRQTLSNLVEGLEEVPGPVPYRQAVSRGARGVIVVRGTDVRGDLDVKSGFASATMAAITTVVASVTVDGRNGRLYGSTVDGNGRANAEAGFACSGGGKSLAKAASRSIQTVSRKIGEGVSNSDRVRKY